MSCKEYAVLLDDLADGKLSGEARGRAESHLRECSACRASLADTRRIREAARALPRLDAPPDGWARLSAALDVEAREAAAAEGGAKPGRWRLNLALPAWRPMWGAVAAAAVLAMAVATTLLLYRVPFGSEEAGAGGTANVQGEDLVSSVETELQLADQHYQNAIAGLEQVWREGQGSVDAQTSAVLQKNIGIIDQAVRESREALRAQPANEVARATLFEALRRKVDLLKDMVALVNEMRKGNQAGAAQIVAGVER